jgi:hypothetical protein
VWGVDILAAESHQYRAWIEGDTTNLVVKKESFDEFRSLMFRLGYHLTLVETEGKRGRAEFSENVQNEKLTNVVSISTGRGLSLALKEDGTVGVLGGNHNEIKEYARQLKDIKSVAADFFVGGAVKEDGTIIIWGDRVEERYKNDDIEKLVLYEGKG